MHFEYVCCSCILDLTAIRADGILFSRLVCDGSVVVLMCNGSVVVLMCDGSAVVYDHIIVNLPESSRTPKDRSHHFHICYFLMSFVPLLQFVSRLVVSL